MTYRSKEKRNLLLKKLIFCLHIKTNIPRYHSKEDEKEADKKKKEMTRRKRSRRQEEEEKKKKVGARGEKQDRKRFIRCVLHAKVP